jgi:hypothetical protein
VKLIGVLEVLIVASAAFPEVDAAGLDALLCWLEHFQQICPCPALVLISQMNPNPLSGQCKGDKDHAPFIIPAEALAAVSHSAQGKYEFIGHLSSLLALTLREEGIDQRRQLPQVSERCLAHMTNAEGLVLQTAVAVGDRNPLPGQMLDELRNFELRA